MRVPPLFFKKFLMKKNGSDILGFIVFSEFQYSKYKISNEKLCYLFETLIKNAYSICLNLNVSILVSA